MAPAGMGKALFANSGSEANDTAIKLAWYVNNALGRPQKKKIISRQRAYHGVTIATASLTGPRVRAHGFRPADRAHPAHRLPVLLPRRAAGRERGGVRGAARRQPGAADPARRSRHGRRLLRRAGDGRRRRDRAAGDLLRPHPADPAEVRHPVRRRRGDLRLRPHRQHVRVADVQPAAGHHDARQGAVGGLPADLGQPGLRARSTRSCSRKATSSASSATATRTRRIRCRRRSRSRR